MTTQTPANADRGKRSIWFWMWFAFLILAGILEFLAKQDASFQLSVQNFNSKMYSATVALSPLSIGKNYYLYMWSGGEPGVTCHSDWISPPQSLWPSLQTGTSANLRSPVFSPPAPLGAVCTCTGNDRTVTAPGLCPERHSNFNFLGALWHTATSVFAEGWLSTVMAAISFALAILTLIAMFDEPLGWAIWLTPLITSLYALFFQGFILAANFLFSWLLAVSAVPVAMAAVGIIKEVGTVIRNHRRA